MPKSAETTTTHWSCLTCQAGGVYEQAASGGAAEKHTKATNHATTTSLRPRTATYFAVGERVEKVSGYEFDAYVVASFTTREGERFLVCESAHMPGLLRIFSPAQMRSR